MTLKDIENKVMDTWNNHKWLVIVVAVPVLLFKIRNIIIDLLLQDSKHIADQTVKKDQQLAKEESDDNTKANEIIKDADAEKKASDDQQVDDHWYEKK